MKRILARYHTWTWAAIKLTILVGVAAVFATDPIRNAVTFGPVGDARLERSFGYVILGPISALFDAMTLFSVGQIIGFTVWMMICYLAVRLYQRWFVKRSLVRELVYAVASFAALLVIYALVLVMPRPMARLVLTRADVIAVDFHSHTMYSHDGRPGWSAAKNRAWHTEGGFNAAYITDHRTFDGVKEGLALDSGYVGEGPSTTILPGIEVFFHGEHVNLLNAPVRYKGLTTRDLTSIDDTALAYASVIPNLEPVLIETIPGDLSAIIPQTGLQSAGVRAIELVAGSPRGMTQVKRDHDRIVQLADSLDLALVVGSDNHGWGRAAPGWTLVRIPGTWRTYAPDSLANTLDDIIRQGRRRATYVVERTTAGASPLALAFTGPMVLWTVLRTISPEERIAWLCWLWIPVVLGWWIRRRSATT